MDPVQVIIIITNHIEGMRSNTLESQNNHDEEKAMDLVFCVPD